MLFAWIIVFSQYIYIVKWHCSLDLSLTLDISTRYKIVHIYELVCDVLIHAFIYNHHVRGISTSTNVYDFIMMNIQETKRNKNIAKL